jgi:hypothetical protein
VARKALGRNKTESEAERDRERLCFLSCCQSYASPDRMGKAARATCGLFKPRQIWYMEVPQRHMYYIGLDVHKKTISYAQRT